MSGSNLVQLGAVPGLTLRAWAVVSAAGGAMVKGSNVAGLVKNAAGDFTLTLAANMPDTAIVLEVRGAGTGPLSAVMSSIGVGSVGYRTYMGGALQDTPGNHWIGVYG